jgi:hypothetical protein
MSEESEKAAKWDMLVSLKKERAHLEVLFEQARDIGKNLERLGRLLGNAAWTFRVTGESIHGERRDEESSTLETPLDFLNAEKITKLISDINETRSNILRLQKSTEAL